MTMLAQPTALSSEIRRRDRIAGQRRGMARERDAPFLQTEHFLRCPERLHDVLLDNDQGAAFGDNRGETRIEVAHHDRREAEAELVAEKKAWIRHQRAADRRHLLLAAGKRAAGQMAALGEHGKELIDAREAPRSRSAKLPAD